MTAETPRDRAVEVLTGAIEDADAAEMSDSDLYAHFAEAAVSALLASPGILRELAGQAEPVDDDRLDAAVADQWTDEFGPYLAEKMRDPEFQRAFRDAEVRADLRRVGMDAFDESPTQPGGARIAAEAALDATMDAIADRAARGTATPAEPDLRGPGSPSDRIQ